MWWFVGALITSPPVHSQCSECSCVADKRTVVIVQNVQLVRQRDHRDCTCIIVFGDFKIYCCHGGQRTIIMVWGMV